MVLKEVSPIQDVTITANIYPNGSQKLEWIKKGILIDSGVEVFEKTGDADVKFELITD